MKYFVGGFNDNLLYYDTDVNRAFNLTPSYARKHRIEGVSFKNHKMVCDFNNKYRKHKIIKSLLSGLELQPLNVESSNTIIAIEPLYVDDDIACQISFDGNVVLPLPFEYMLNLRDLDSFNKNKCLLADTYRGRIINNFGSVDSFLNTEFKLYDGNNVFYDRIIKSRDLSAFKPSLFEYSSILESAFYNSRYAKPTLIDTKFDYYFNLRSEVGLTYDRVSIEWFLSKINKYMRLPCKNLLKLDRVEYGV